MVAKMDFDIFDSFDNDEISEFPNDIEMTALWLSHIIRIRRKSLSLTQGTIASALGLGMSAISSIEAGNSFANIKRTLKVMNYLRLPFAPILMSINSQIMIHSIEGFAPTLLNDGKSLAWNHLEVFQATDPHRLVVLDKQSGKTHQVTLSSPHDTVDPASAETE